MILLQLYFQRHTAKEQNFKLPSIVWFAVAAVSAIFLIVLDKDE